MAKSTALNAMAKSIKLKNRRIKSLNTWYGWLILASLLAGMEWSLLVTSNLDYRVLLVVAVCVAGAGFMSFLEALRGGLTRSHRKPKNERAKKHVLNASLSRLSAVIIVLTVGVFIAGAALGAPLARYEEQFSSTEVHETQKRGSTAEHIDSVESSNSGARRANDAPANSTTQNHKPDPISPGPKPDKSGCEWYDDIPYKTETKPDSRMIEGQTRTIGGYNGWRKVCTNTQGKVISDETTSEPTNKIVYYGTMTSEKALEEARSTCRRIVPAGSQNSTFWGDCVKKEMNKLGWYFQDGVWIYR